MTETNNSAIKDTEKENQLHPANGMAMLMINLCLMVFTLFIGMFSFSMVWRNGFFALIGFSSFLYLFLIGPFFFRELKNVK